jgi:hypothetical protein
MDVDQALLGVSILIDPALRFVGNKELRPLSSSPGSFHFDPSGFGLWWKQRATSHFFFRSTAMRVTSQMP